MSEITRNNMLYGVFFLSKTIGQNRKFPIHPLKYKIIALVQSWEALNILRNKLFSRSLGTIVVRGKVHLSW